MAKKITELQLIASITDSLNIPSDNGIQSYRATALQLKNYVLNRLNLPVGAIARSEISEKTANYTAQTSDDVIVCDTSGGAFTITLPDATGIDGRKLLIKLATAGNTLVIDGYSTQTIDGDATHELRSDDEFIEITALDGNWIITNSRYTEVVIAYLGSDTSEYFDGNWASGLSITPGKGKFILDYRALIQSRISGSATNTYGYLRTILRDIDDSSYLLKTQSKTTRFYHDDGVTGLDFITGETPEPVDLSSATEFELYYGVNGSSGGSTSIGITLSGQSDQGWGASGDNTWIRARRVG